MRHQLKITRRRSRTTPVRRMRRLLAAGLCAGSTLLGSAADLASADEGIVPVGYFAGPPCQCAPTYPSYSYPCAPDHAATEAPDAQTDLAPEAEAPAPAPTFTSVSTATGTPGAPSSATPFAIGDFFGVAHPARVSSSYGSSYVPDPGTSLTGIVKATENNSPIPLDRVFLDYSYYHGVPFTPDGVNIVRMTPGVEWTMLDGLMSLEVRLPLAETFNNHIVAGTIPGAEDWQVGNLYVAPKLLLYNDDALALAMGMGISTPTAEDVVLTDPGVTEVRYDNKSLHLLPYFGGLATDGLFFTQAYIQVDVDANGNPVLVNGTQLGRFQSQTLLFVDDIFGAWLWMDPSSSTLNGVAGVAELHYTTSLNDGDIVSDGFGNSISAGEPDLEFATGVLGVHLFYAGGARVTFGYGVPLADDRFADGEFRMLLNFGPSLGSLAGSPAIGY